MKSSREYSAFISYASDNRDKADEICASLEARGFVCWIAPRDVRAGREYADEIIRGLERSASVVLVLSEAANISVFVRREVERAVSKQKPVFPVRIEEVTPSPGLELFISGTHWLDAWSGDWDDHMNRLARDLSDSPVATPVSGISSRHRSFSEPRSFRSVYVAAGLVLLVGLGGIAIWSSTDEPEQVDPPFRQDRQVEPPLRRDDGPTPVPPDSPASITKEEEKQDDGPAAKVVKSPPPPTGITVTRGASESGGTRRTSDESTAVGRGGTAPPVVTVEASRELNALTNDYDDLSNRGEVIDDTLNRLWEEMKPASPRVDMVTHQRSLRTNLARTKDALAQKDAAGASRYLDIARADLAVLEQFLNR
jgi:hypothetical protein